MYTLNVPKSYNSKQTVCILSLSLVTPKKKVSNYISVDAFELNLESASLPPVSINTHKNKCYIRQTLLSFSTYNI